MVRGVGERFEEMTPPSCPPVHRQSTSKCRWQRRKAGSCCDRQGRARDDRREETQELGEERGRKTKANGDDGAMVARPGLRVGAGWRGPPPHRDEGRRQ